MATLRDRINALFRYRVGKYDSQTMPNDLGIYGQTTVSGANINETTALTIATVYACAYKIASTVASLELRDLRKANRPRNRAGKRCTLRTTLSNTSQTSTKRLMNFGRQ